MNWCTMQVSMSVQAYVFFIFLLLYHLMVARVSPTISPPLISQMRLSQASGQPAVLVIPRDADLVFPDTALAPDADGTVDRAATLQLGAARRKLLLLSGSGTFAAQVQAHD